MKKRMFFLLMTTFVLVTSCYTSNYSKTMIGASGGEYNDLIMENEHPESILIMPPINRTQNVELKQLFYTTLSMPIAEKGYYVVAPFTALDILKSNSAYDSEFFIEKDLSMFKTVFGTDAILFTRINEYSRIDLTGDVCVNIDYILRSARTNKILFHRQGQVTFDGGFCDKDQSVKELLVAALFTTVNTSMINKFNAIRDCNISVINDFPEGPYAREKIK